MQEKKELVETRATIEDLEAKLNEARDRLSDLAGTILESLPDKKKYFKLDEKFYTLKKRGNRYFVCVTDVEPGSWLKKDKKNGSD